MTVITESDGARAGERMRVETVRSRRPRRLIAALRRLRLARLLEIAVWPDDSVFWVIPAILAGRRAVKESGQTAIVVFMMPYSSGLAGLILSRLTRLPLILNLDDSPTCTDMHPHYPTRLHFHLARITEDAYARYADAIVYVSKANLEAASVRQPETTREKFHLVRYGADTEEIPPRPTDPERFDIAYVGAMSGWWALVDQPPAGPLRRAYVRLNQLGRYERTVLDQRTSSPVIVGKAIVDALAEHPSWAGRVKLTIHGNPYPESVVARALASSAVESAVTVLGPVPHELVTEIIQQADLLFLTLPGRLDGSRGGRISAKTYEYLTTDRPILAALPQGENWDYLTDKPGVWLVAPDDDRRMREIIVELAKAKFAGSPRTFDRSYLRPQLSYEARASDFAAAIRAGVERHGR